MAQRGVILVISSDNRLVPSRVIATVPETPMIEVMRLMRQHSISCVIVAQGDTPVGIITERDIARTGARLEGRLIGYSARELMSADLAVMQAGGDLYEAYALMLRRNIRHLVIVDGQGRSAGVLTLSDLVQELGAEYLADMKRVSDVMSRDIITVSEKATLLEAMRLMAQISISCLICLQGDRPVGIVTERDIVGQLVKGREALTQRICKVVLGPVLTVSEEEYAFEAATLMNEHGVRHLVVLDEAEKVTGLVTQSDIVGPLIQRHVDLEMQVRKRTFELAAKNDELLKANQQLTNLDGMKSTFLSSVSHELRTPLTSLLGFAKLIDRDFAGRIAPLVEADRDLAPMAERIRKNLSIIIDEGQRMTRLVNDFLDLTKIESGKMQWRDEDISTTDFILHAAQAVRGHFDTKPGVDLEVLAPADLPLVRADKDRLLQVMINLLGNAAKFTHQGKVTVKAAMAPDDMVEIMISDTGVGMSPDELDKAFDKFHQATSRDRDGEIISGTGLGLPISREIVEHYGGRIWATSSQGKGSTFHFRLPAASAKGNTRTKPAPAPPAKPRGNGRGPLALVVDDDPAVREFLSQLLVREGLRAAEAQDGVSALKRARELQPDLIIMDLLMPGMDGGAAISRLREDPLTQAVPVLVLSAYTDLATARGDAALRKPVDESAFLQAVKCLLQGGRFMGGNCIVMPRRKRHSNLLTISSGKLKYVKPGEIDLQTAERFQGTAFLPMQGQRFDDHLDHLRDFDDALVVIMPGPN